MGFRKGRVEAVRSGDDAHDVGLLHDQEVLTVDLDLGAGPLAEQHAVAGLHVEGDELAALVTGAGTSRHDLALLGLLLGGVGNDDAALGLLLRLKAADDDAVVQGTELHSVVLHRTRGADGCRAQLWHSERESAKHYHASIVAE